MGHGMGHGDFHGVGGEITAIDGSIITLKTFRGETAKVKVTASTRVRKDGEDAKLSDFKVGDRVMVAGEQDKDGVWVAQILGQRRAGQGSPHGGAMGGPPAAPEDNGKTYIFGNVTKIDGTKLTVRKPDGAEQSVEVDDNTSFLNERRESITLADFKVGDTVRGQGAVKDGLFVPKQLRQVPAHPGHPPQGASADSQPGAPPQGQAQQGEGAPDSSK